MRSAKHARRRPKWAYLISGVVGVLALIGALFLGPVSPAGAVTPSQDACHTTNNATPVGNCGPFHQLYRDSFNPGGVVAAIPVGAFNHCGGDGDYHCAGLLAKTSTGAYVYTHGPHYYATLGAYPNGWEDTATSGADGNGGQPFGGYYRPQDTISVVKTSTGDGVMRVHMYRPLAGGSNHVAAVVPEACRNLRYGKFTERLVVRTLTRGYKMAHLHYSPDEIDYPEAGGTFAGDPVSVFTHGFDEYGRDVAPNSEWIKFHTYSTEITPNHVRIYFDGKLVASRTADYPDKTPWVLQNESALGGAATAAKGSSVDIDTSWITCYSYSP